MKGIMIAAMIFGLTLRSMAQDIGSGTSTTNGSSYGTGNTNSNITTPQIPNSANSVNPGTMNPNTVPSIQPGSVNSQNIGTPDEGTVNSSIRSNGTVNSNDPFYNNGNSGTGGSVNGGTINSGMINGSSNGSSEGSVPSTAPGKLY